MNKYKITGTFDEQIDSSLVKAIESIYKKIKATNEFELMFFSTRSSEHKLGMEQFLKILEYLNYRSKAGKLKILNTATLDISYTKQMGDTYRITITDVDSINKYIEMLHKRKNHVVFNILAGLSEKDKNIKIMQKIKERENIIDIEDFNLRVRLSEENDVDTKTLNELKKLDETHQHEIMYRYKQRVSLIIEDDKEATLSVDLTNIKMARQLNKIEFTIPSYELEIDITSHSKSPSEKYLKTMYKETNILLKILQQSNFVISKSIENEVLGHYASILGVEKSKMISLEGRKPISLEVQHVVDQLPNKYAVTDKADGERYFLIIYDGAVFLISDTLHVKNTGIIIDKKYNKYNDSILDGEYIFIAHLNRHLFMVFDCLFVGNVDMRQTSQFFDRIRKADEIISNVFVMKNQVGYGIKEYSGEFNMDKIIDFHTKEIKIFMKTLNADMNHEKQYPLIRRKYFMGALGGKNNEIFAYSELMWKLYVFDKEINCPYILDGLIYQPLDQKYVTSVKEIKFFEYKWKPAEKNSVDFYIRFERSKDTGKILTLYDNSREGELGEEEEDFIRDKPYRIVNLYVGKTLKDKEQPILFEPEKDSVKHVAYLFLQDGEVRDVLGHILQDDTVVEFYYNIDPNIPDKHRWVPLRTRFDKTESVQRFGKKYGNYYNVAYKVWRSIKNPFTMDDITILTDDRAYTKHIDILRGKIDHSIIMSEAKENAYFQIRTSLGKSMGQFHNWMDSILIYTHVNQTYEKGRHLTVLDISCKKGIDLLKFYYGQVEFYVGIEVDNNSLMSPIDGAISRYTQMKKTHANFPRMFFIHADAGALLDVEDQTKALGTMTDVNKNLIEKFFSDNQSKRTLFDRLHCKLAMDNFLENDQIWNNFLTNVNNCLAPSGYMIITTLDGERIMEALKDKLQYTVYYTNPNGEQKVMFDIVKKYETTPENKLNGTGMPIDMHDALRNQDGVYLTKYLVNRKFIEKEFLEKCNMEIVDTDLFDNQYIIHKDYFLNSAIYEDVEKTRKFLKDVQGYYTEKSDIHNACYQMTKLYRYYIFRKKDDGKVQNKVQNKENKQTEQVNKNKQTEQVKENKSKKVNNKKINKKQKGGDDDDYEEYVEDETEEDTEETYTEEITEETYNRAELEEKQDEKEAENEVNESEKEAVLEEYLEKDEEKEKEENKDDSELYEEEEAEEEQESINKRKKKMSEKEKEKLKIKNQKVENKEEKFNERAEMEMVLTQKYPTFEEDKVKEYGLDEIFTDASSLLSSDKYIKRNIKSNKDYSLMTSIHDILKNSGIIPKSIPVNKFYKEIQIEMVKDQEFNQKTYDKLNKSLVIAHDYSASELSTEEALNGINIMVIKKDCDDKTIVEKYGPRSKINQNIPSVILYHDGNKYCPIYKVQDHNVVGMFDSKMKFIKDLARK